MRKLRALCREDLHQVHVARKLGDKTHRTGRVEQFAIAIGRTAQEDGEIVFDTEFLRERCA